MAIRIPTSFVAGRPVTLEGTSYAPGAEIPPGVVKRVRRLGALLSRRWIIPRPDPHRTRLRETTPRPTEAGSRFRAAIVEPPP